jgi:hypothetical protein
MVPLLDMIQLLTTYLYNHIQIENTFPDLKSRNLCTDVSPKLIGYPVVLFLKSEKGREVEISDLLALSLFIPISSCS